MPNLVLAVRLADGGGLWFWSIDTGGSLIHFLGMDGSDTPINVLCIGTTGMLAGMTSELVSSGHRVYAIARTDQSLERCALGIPEDHRDRFVGCRCNYADPESWARVLDEIPDPIDQVVCWIHRSAPYAFDQVLERFPDSDILRVGSSSTSRVEAASQNYRTVILGALRDGASVRWLTHEEISAGVMDAIWSRERVSVVGLIGD